VVAAGGRGGAGVVRPTREDNFRRMTRRRQAEADAYGEEEVIDVEDVNWKDDAQGLPGEETGITLTLRVVADVGLVGLPNAGKSSLLAALTHASPEIAPYPFTTLMPNLGVMERGAPGAAASAAAAAAAAAPSSSAVSAEEEEAEDEGEPDWAGIDWANVSEEEVEKLLARERARSDMESIVLDASAKVTPLPTGKEVRAPILADLPGLIEGAHVGRGLGRMFLRHLKRTRILLQVVDATSPNADSDYFVVREELRMYNPEYTARPHVVALNKMDLFGDEGDSSGGGGENAAAAHEAAEALRQKILTIAEDLRAQNGGEPSVPLAVLPVSAVRRAGLEGLNEALDAALRPVLARETRQAVAREKEAFLQEDV
jgi:GTPase involved in cell partitioning and DNA repair